MRFEEINAAFRKLLPVVAGFLAFLLVIYGWLISIKYLPRIAAGFFPELSGKSMGSYGEIGEMYGAVNGLFSGLALMVVALLMWHQRLDAKRYRQEREATLSDFEANRLNNLIMAQVNRIEYQLESIAFHDLDGEEYAGSYGVDFLNAALKSKDIQRYRTGEMDGREGEMLLVHNFKSIKKLLLVIAQSNQTLDDQINIARISAFEKERLYAIYLRNMGASLLVLLRKLEAFTDLIIHSENTYSHKEMDFSNPIFVLSELSAGFFHNIASNCQGELVGHILPEPIS